MLSYKHVKKLRFSR